MDETVDSLQRTITMLVTSLVDDASAATISTTEGHSLVIFEIRCPQSEMGKVVGKSGRNIQALRTIMSAIGAKHKKRVQVEVIEPA